MNLFLNKFKIITGNIPQYTFGQFHASINQSSILYIIKLILYIYISVAFILLIFINLLNAIQNFINRENLKNSIFYMLFYIGIILGHLFVEVSPRYYMPALVPLTIIVSIAIYNNLINNKKQVNK